MKIEISDTPTTGETDAQNATRGASDSTALASYGGLREATAFDVTAAAGVTITAQNSYETETHIVISFSFSVTVAIPYATNIVTLTSAQMPFKQIQSGVFMSTANTIYPTFFNTGLLSIRNLGGTIPIGTGYSCLTVSYPKK